MKDVVAALLAAALAVAVGVIVIAQGDRRSPPPEPPRAPRAEERRPPIRRAPPRRAEPRAREPRIAWRASVALGRPTAGRLVRGVRLPAEGAHFVTWDPVRKRTPNRAWRRYATDGVVAVVLRTLDDFAGSHDGAPRILVGDLSRTHGGDFGKRFGPLGHASHQNGLDVDVYYPRTDGRERAARTPRQVDRVLAQDLVDRFVRAGAQRIFVGSAVGLHGPDGVVQIWPNHDDHLHVRFAVAPPR